MKQIVIYNNEICEVIGKANFGYIEIKSLVSDQIYYLKVIKVATPKEIVQWRQRHDEDILS